MRTMQLFGLSKTKILIIIPILFVLAGIFYFTMTRAPTSNNRPAESSPNSSNIQQNESPRIVSTKPDPLEEAIISANEVVEITFNRSLENVGEFKSRIEPKIDYKVELSGDRKTAKIIPKKLYELGATYTLFIGTETKFDGVGRWGEEKVYHFKTITYRGV